ncbi:MAG: class I SAM-dependent methyltransferase [Acidobacteria bacterium]|nr:class I SAM-dependent methyltransferase [Acidobacteriota bacterium]
MRRHIESLLPQHPRGARWPACKIYHNNVKISLRRRMCEDSILRPLTEQEVSKIFADPQSEAAQRWKSYWASTESRNANLLAQFRQVVSLGFAEKTVLDVGCGSAGLASAIVAEDGHYLGIDYSPYILRMGQHWLRQRSLRGDLLRASGSELPFKDESFDYIFAFDVIEHLEHGIVQQLQFLLELRRLIRPMGMIFLTTPNRWYPFEGHTFLYFPQYLPTKIADQYIRRRNPGFLQEHSSFEAIKLLTPAALQRLLHLSKLSFLHQLPCCMDVEDLPWIKRFAFRVLRAAGLAWYPMQEFWGCLVRRENRSHVRVKCRKLHPIALQECEHATGEFASQVDFDCGAHGHQLKNGWFPPERVQSGFRWTTDTAELWLQANGKEEFLSLSGYCNASARSGPVTLDVYCDNHWIGHHQVLGDETFEVRFLLPYRLYRSQICAIRLAAHPAYIAADPDFRRLGAAIRHVALVPAFPSRVDFNRESESPALQKGWFAHERDGRGFCWTTDVAEVWLRAKGDERFLLVSGYCNAADRCSPVTLRIDCDNHCVGRHRIEGNEKFNLWLPLPARLDPLQIYSIRLRVHPCYTPGGADLRKLGVAITEIAFLSESEFGSQVDFNLGPEHRLLQKGWFDYETDRRGFRWTADEAEVWLRSNGTQTSLQVSGYCNASSRLRPVTLQFCCNDRKVGEHWMEQDAAFNLELPLPQDSVSRLICRIRLITEPAYAPAGADHRRLGVVIFRIALA